ncbi:D-aminoacyl-tRNA deacylase [Gammaproteobacteria bacterium AH-315-C21]|nr:D-aminoacyl-tRNA deacylase [Gammaproteobacteria bacterium AH-315-C21]
MIAPIQCVTSAAVDVKAKRVAKIECGILLLLAVEHNDTVIITERMIDRVLAYRVF